MKQLLLAAMVLSTTAMAAATARANVTYDFVQQSASGGDPYSPGYPFTGNFEHISITFTDAQVETGSASGTAHCSNGAYSCNGISGFVTSSGAGYGRIEANLTFNPDGTLSGSITNDSSPGPGGSGGYDYTISGIGTNWTGTLLDTDDHHYEECGARQSPCTFTGHFSGPTLAPSTPTSVPEPASFAMLAVGLLGVGAVRRCIG